MAKSHVANPPHICYIVVYPNRAEGRNTMETKALLNNLSSLSHRSPILTDMLERLSMEVTNPILNSSPAIKEMQNKEKTKL